MFFGSALQSNYRPHGKREEAQKKEMADGDKVRDNRRGENELERKKGKTCGCRERHKKEN